MHIFFSVFLDLSFLLLLFSSKVYKFIYYNFCSSSFRVNLTFIVSWWWRVERAFQVQAKNLSQEYDRKDVLFEMRDLGYN